MSSALFNRAPPGSPWPVKDIVYVSIVGSIMLAALLEWILWLFAFLFCLAKVVQKAENWFAFCSFAGLLTVPWLFCVYQLVTNNVGRSRRIKYVLDEHTAPKVVIIMPCYNEEPEILLRTVDSIADCEYPPSCLHVFLSFDGEDENELYLRTIEKLGVPITLDSFPRSIDIAYRGCRITVSRFPHGGKRSCQKQTFRLIDRVYQNYLRRRDDLFMLFIDSDCILDRHCIQNFMYEMELKPGSSRNMLAQTGIITSTTAKHKLITLLQDMEYVHGALTMLRFSAFRKLAKFYFADKAEQCEDHFDYWKNHLGEDRFLTHLFMISARERYQIQMNTGAFCKTEAVQTFKSLLKQRRRWFLGFITNEVCMLTDARIWRRYPLLLVIRLAQNTIRTTALLFFILIISLLTTSQKISNLPVGFIAVSLGLNWVLMIYFAAKLGRYKVVLYPLMFVVNPAFNWLYMVYGIFTAGQRTWGGPRADAGKADEKTTAAQVVAEAEAYGDDLNVDPETFRPAAEARTNRYIHAPLQPPNHLQGRFAPAEQLPGGWYHQANNSSVLQNRQSGDIITLRSSRRTSWQSLGLGSRDSSRSTLVPRRVESIVGPEAVTAYQNQQAAQRPAGGAYYEAPRLRSAPRTGMVQIEPEHGPNVGLPAEIGTDKGKQRAASVRSVGSDSSVLLHFGVPRRSLEPEPPAQVPSYIPTRAQEDTTTMSSLAPPVPTYQPGSSAVRNGRSPLARKSFTHLAPTSPTGSRREVEVEVRVPRRTSTTEDEERRGRRGRRSISVDGQGRRRLSKQRQGSKEPRR
ncbi:hypothetical protein MBLNU13_g03831t2 [Cladosporium sp. NU13]